MQYVEGYELLANILTDAFEQSATGKGRERHGLGDPWDKQPIITLGREFGIGGTNFQSAKKMREAQKMAERGEYAAAERELLGAIVYAAASVALVREAAEKKPVQAVKVGQGFAPSEEKNPIPMGVFWDGANDVFRNGDGTVLMNYGCWLKRKEEFPAYVSRPL